MTEFIAVAALIVSTLLLIVHYVNQRERRHGELVQLRSDYLSRIASVQQRLAANILHAETARLELRSAVESEDKYLSIEEMPNVIQEMRLLSDKIKQLRSDVESLDTLQNNKTEVLLHFQWISHDFKSVETDLDGLENQMLDLVAHIRAQQQTQVPKKDAQHPPAN